MNDYKFSCPNCGQSISATVEQAGLTVRCLTCKQRCRAPVPERAANAPPPVFPIQSHAAHVFAGQPRPPKPSGLKALWWTLGVGAVLAFLVFAFASTLGRSWVVHSRRPGEARFNAANHQLDMYRGKAAFGNSTQAVAVAERFSSSMKELRTELFQGGKPNGFSLSSHEFITCCELHDDKCAIIVHVPELRRFTGSAKKNLGELAWLTAHDILKTEGATKPGMKLAIGVRGFARFDRVLIGVYDSGAFTPTNQPFETVTGFSPEERLFPWFESPPPASITNQPTATK